MNVQSLNIFCKIKNLFLDSHNSLPFHFFGPYNTMQQSGTGPVVPGGHSHSYIENIQSQQNIESIQRHHIIPMPTEEEEKRHL